MIAADCPPGPQDGTTKVPEMDPVYYSVNMHSRNRKQRLSYGLLVQIPGTLAEGGVSSAHERWAIDAAKQIFRGHKGVVWDINAGLYENPQIPQTAPKTAEYGSWTALEHR